MSISEYACDADLDYRFHVAPPLGDVVAAQGVKIDQVHAGLNALQLRINQDVNRIMHELSHAYVRIAALEAELAHRKMNEAE